VNTSTGEVVQRRDYDPWGAAVTDSNAVFQALGYAGGLTDPATGLVRFGARDYEPGVARWTSKDPIRFDGGANVFAYVTNTPLDFIDPSGLLAYNCTQTQEFIQWAGEDARGLHGLLAALQNHHNPGYLDFETHETGSTFVLENGRVMRADEFGNFLAGYAGYRFIGDFGYALVRVAGVAHNVLSDLRAGRGLNLDKDSKADLRAGRADARQEDRSGQRCDCPK
jgi:RHS repeat-associated protein